MTRTYTVTFQSGLTWSVVAGSRTDATVSASELNPGDKVVQVSQSVEWVESMIGEDMPMKDPQPLRDRMSDFGFEVKKPQGGSKSQADGTPPKQPPTN